MKITGKKLLAVLCTVVMLVTTIIPSFAFTASAADTTITFTLGANGSTSHNDGSEKSTYSETVNGYTLNITGGSKMYIGARDNKGNSAIKLGTGSAAGTFKFTVPSDVTSVVIYIAKYKTNTTKINVNGAAYTLTKNSNDGAYDAITVDTTTTKIIELKTVSGGYRAMVNTIEFVIPQGANVCEHTNKTTITNEATCTEKGSQKIVCDDCGATISENDIAANGHNFVDFVCTECGVKAPSEATYVFSDYTAGTQYADNEEHKLDGLLTVITTDSHFTSELRIYSSSTYNGYAILKSAVPMSELSFNAGNKADTLNVYGKVDGEWVLIKGVSVTSAYANHTVDFGGKVYDEIKLDVQGTNQVRLKNITVSYYLHVHTPGEDVIENNKAADCVNGGSYDNVIYCTECGEELSRETVTVDALGHDYKAVVTAPDCVNGGYTTYTCTVCGDTYTADEVAAAGHNYEAVVTDPDCVNGGYTTYTCTTCGHSYVADETEALGHSYDDGVYTAPTVDADGYTTYTCSKCGHEDVKTNEGTQLKAVAKIGEQRYASLQAAIDAANAGDTITLLDNINEGATINKAITLDGAGFTITGTVTVEGHRDVVETVKFVNVKFFSDGAKQSARCVSVKAYSEVIFEGCDFTSGATDVYHNGIIGIEVLFNCTVEVKNCNASKLFYMIYASSAIDTNINVDGCTMSEMFYGIGSYGCAATIKNTTYSGYSYGIYARNINTTLDLENVTINASHDKAIMMAAPVGSTGGTYIIYLTGDNYANGVEMLAKADSVWLERENEEDSYQIKHIGHTVNSAVEENRKEPTCTTEGSYDKVYYCDNCGVVIGRETLPIPAKGHSYEAVVTAPTYVADGYTTYTCACGDTYQADITSKLIFKIETNVIVGETFDLMFGFSKKQFSEAGVVMVELYAANNPDEKYAFTVDQLGVNGNYYTVSYEGLFAYQMCDEIVINVYDNNGNMIGTKSDTMQDYAMRMFDKAKESEKTVFVDMLVYGAAAQEHFAYNTSNPATKDLTEAQMEYASELKALENKYDNINNYSKYYRGSQLVVGSHIQFQLAFKGGAYATVSYTNYLGKDVVYENIALENKILTLDFLSAADARETLTITVFNEDGSVYVELNESIESYCARNLDKSPAFAAFMKFADSAKAHLAPKAAN